MPSIEIGDRRVGPGKPVYIVAEMSANHNRNFDEAVRIIKAAKQCGADAVKLQTFTPDTITFPSEATYFRIAGGTIWDGQKLYDLYSKTFMPWEWQPQLKTIANDLSLDLFSSAFDPTAVDFLETMGVPVHKIASLEIVDIPLIEKMASTGKPLIISTGMASLGEIEEAVGAAYHAGATQMALLKCTSAYPAPPEEMNLETIRHLAETFGIPVGLSDHTVGIAVPIAAVALGASMVEKHFTLSRSIPGPDTPFSLEPEEFRAMVEGIRITEQAVGRVHYGITGNEAKSLAFRRSLFVVRDVESGDAFTEGNVRSIRPGHGLHPRYLRTIMGRHASQDIKAGTPLSWEHLSSECPPADHPMTHSK
jgi:pseudaminic acid synthase